MSVGRIPVLIMGFSFEDALLVDFLAIWWCSRWEGRNLVVVELEWVDSFLLEDRHASYLAAQPATSSWKLLHHDGVVLGDCNISASPREDPSLPAGCIVIDFMSIEKHSRVSILVRFCLSTVSRTCDFRIFRIASSVFPSMLIMYRYNSKISRGRVSNHIISQLHRGQQVASCSSWTNEDI